MCNHKILFATQVLKIERKQSNYSAKIEISIAKYILSKEIFWSNELNIHLPIKFKKKKRIYTYISSIKHSSNLSKNVENKISRCQILRDIYPKENLQISITQLSFTHHLSQNEFTCSMINKRTNCLIFRDCWSLIRKTERDRMKNLIVPRGAIKNSEFIVIIPIAFPTMVESFKVVCFAFFELHSNYTWGKFMKFRNDLPWTRMRWLPAIPARKPRRMGPPGIPA